MLNANSWIKAIRGGGRIGGVADRNANCKVENGKCLLA